MLHEGAVLELAGSVSRDRGEQITPPPRADMLWPFRALLLLFAINVASVLLHYADNVLRLELYPDLPTTRPWDIVLFGTVMLAAGLLGIVMYASEEASLFFLSPAHLQRDEPRCARTLPSIQIAWAFFGRRSKRASHEFYLRRRQRSYSVRTSCCCTIAFAEGATPCRTLRARASNRSRPLRQIPGCQLAHPPGGLGVDLVVVGQHDSIVALGRLAADIAVDDVVSHALDVAGEGIAVAAAAGGKIRDHVPGMEFAAEHAAVDVGRRLVAVQVSVVRIGDDVVLPALLPLGFVGVRNEDAQVERSGLPAFKAPPGRARFLENGERAEWRQEPVVAHGAESPAKSSRAAGNPGGNRHDRP